MGLLSSPDTATALVTQEARSWASKILAVKETGYTLKMVQCANIVSYFLNTIRWVVSVVMAYEFQEISLGTKNSYDV